MPAQFLFANNAQTVMANAITASATTLTVAAGEGQNFPQPGTNQVFTLGINDAATGLLHEIVYVTAVSGDTMTVLRAQEGTTARAWAASDIVYNGPTAATLAALQGGVPSNAIFQVGSGNWTVPANVSTVKIRAWAAGGGGGGTVSGGNSAAGGGGAGAYTEGYLPVTAGSSIAYVVGASGAGAGGSSNATGGLGGATTFGPNIIVNGGSGGQGAGAGATGAGGAGGTSSGPLLNFGGATGGGGYFQSASNSAGQVTFFFGGSGSGAPFGAGLVPSSPAQGAAGSGPGGGGGGGANGGGGGSGGNGLIILEWN